MRGFSGAAGISRVCQGAVGADVKPVAISAARAAAGLTQTQAAALIYCTLRGWQDWEAGKRAMHPAFFELFLLKLKACCAQK